MPSIQQAGEPTRCKYYTLHKGTMYILPVPRGSRNNYIISTRAIDVLILLTTINYCNNFSKRYKNFAKISMAKMRSMIT